MTIATISSDFELRQKHLTSMIHSLTHRLEVARACQNEQLTALLEQEYQQLMRQQEASRSSMASLRLSVQRWLQHLWSNFADTMPNLYQLQITQLTNDAGQPYWHVYYPKTGQTLVTDSEIDVHAWVKQTYWKA